MAREEWGTKRSCAKCATRFYDLRRDPITCPACGHTVTLAEITGARGASAAAPSPAKSSKAPAKKAAEAAPETGESVLVEGGDDSDDLSEDVLEEDDDSVPLDDLAEVASDDDEG